MCFEIENLALRQKMMQLSTITTSKKDKIYELSRKPHDVAEQAAITSAVRVEEDKQSDASPSQAQTTVTTSCPKGVSQRETTEEPCTSWEELESLPDRKPDAKKPADARTNAEETGE